MIFTGYTIDFLDRNTLYKNIHSLYSGKQLLRQLALQVFFYQYFVDFFPGFERFHDRPDSENQIILFHIL